jgi:hypothetical protein
MSLASTSTAPLTSSQTALILALVLGGALLAGLVVILGRWVISPRRNEASSSVVRSWLAISLVLGLLIFCGASFELDDTTLRSTLMGGLVASVGAAVAFYFSSKGADQARTDILNSAAALARGAMAPTAFGDATPPGATANSQYTYTFKANGQPTPTYSVGGGKLPDGLALDESGTLAGSPTTAGSYTFSVVASNSAGSLAKELTLTVS